MEKQYPLKKARVSAQVLKSYDLEEVVAALRDLLAPMGGMEAFVKKGDRVLLKPNWIAPSVADAAVVTHPAIILAVARLIREAGGQPFAADSPPLASVHKTARRSGFFDYEEATLCPARELKKRHRLPAAIAGPVKGFVFAISPSDFDVHINLPKLKVHGQLVMTGAIKNTFGLVKGRGKAWLHFAQSRTDDHFHRMLIQCHATMRPHLNIMDGVTALSRWGPRHGDPHEVGLLLASVDPVALDRVVCDAVSVDPAAVPLLAVGQSMGLGRADRDGIEIVGVDPSSLNIVPITLPESLIPIRFSLIHIIKGFFRKIKRHLER